MRAWLTLWAKRVFGIILCIWSWLIAMGLYSLGQGWFEDTVAIHDFHDLFLHAMVWLLGPTGGAVFFFLAGIFILWAFLLEDDPGDTENRN